MSLEAPQTIQLPYSPHRGQEKFHWDRFEVPYRALLGGTGSGKTLAGVAEDLYWSIKHPGIVGYIFEPTFPMVKRILIPTFEKLLGSPLESSPLVENFNRGDMKITFTNLSVLWLGSLDNPERAEGPNIDFIHLDEARLVRDFDTAWKVIQRRLRGSGGGHPIGAWVTSTPDHPGSPMHRFFEDPRTKSPEAQVFRMSVYANRANLPKAYIKELERGHTGGLAERFLWGRFADVAEGALGFDLTKHVVDMVNLDRLQKVVYGMDFGWTNPAAIVAVGIDGDGRAYVLDEFYKSRASDSTIIEAVKSFQHVYGIGTIYCDRSEPRMIEKMNRAGLKAVPSKGKREDGIRDMGSRFKEAGDGRYRLYVHQKCVNLISELQTYNPAKKENDHATDALRYALTAPLKKRVRYQGIVF